MVLNDMKEIYQVEYSFCLIKGINGYAAENSQFPVNSIKVEVFRIIPMITWNPTVYINILAASKLLSSSGLEQAVQTKSEMQREKEKTAIQIDEIYIFQ